MIYLGSVGIRYLEAALLVFLVAAAVLLFMRRRPAGLVWFSAAAMACMAAHLFLEVGRWQLAPACLLLFVLSFWLARPAGQRYRSARPYRTPGLVVRVAVTLFVVSALLPPFAAPLFRVPRPEGEHPVGTASILARWTGAASPEAETTEYVRIWYPAAATAATVAPYWSADDLLERSLPGVPPLLATHLSLVPTPAGQRAPMRDAALPLLLILPDEGALPGDYLRFALESASDGWLVACLPGQPDTERALQTIAAFGDPDTDSALAGRVDRNHVAILVVGSMPAPDLGLPTLRVADDSVFTANLAGGGFAVDYPGAEIPDQAYTTRHLMTLPSGLLVGSSDVAPSRLDSVVRHLMRTVLADGSPDAPVFSGVVPSHETLLSGADGAAIRMIAVSR